MSNACLYKLLIHKPSGKRLKGLVIRVQPRNQPVLMSTAGAVLRFHPDSRSIAIPDIILSLLAAASAIVMWPALHNSIRDRRRIAASPNPEIWAFVRVAPSGL